MDTPPYSDISALSPGGHPIHVNGDTLPNAVAHSNGAGVTAFSAANASNVGPVLYSSSWTALESPPPPTLREILSAYKQKGDGDRDMLLAMLSAKTAEDQRISSQLSLRRTMLEVNKYTIESRSPSLSQLQYQHATHSYGHAQHADTYVPDEPYAVGGTNHHHVAPTSPPSLPHTYSPSYPSSHTQAFRSHAHLRSVESPPLSSVTQKNMLSGTRARPTSLHSHSRSATRLVDGRSQIHAVPASQSQAPMLVQDQGQRRKRARHVRSRSRSPLPLASASSSHRAYTYSYTRSPPTCARPASHSQARSEIDAEVDRSPYSSASVSDSGSPRGCTSVHVSGQGQGHKYSRTMAIGSLLSAGAKTNAVASAAPVSSSKTNGSGSNGTTNGVAVAGCVKEERSEREQEPEQLENGREEAWAQKSERGRERRASRDER